MSEKKVLEGSDGGLNLEPDRELTKEIWLREAFPEWKTLLNKEIEETKLKPNTFMLWWLGGCGWWMKTAGGADICIDQNALSGGSLTYNEINKYSGVVRMSGASQMSWLRCIPHVLDPFEVKKCDTHLSTHIHGDHCDFYTVKTLLKQTDCRFVGPPECVDIFKRFRVPDDRIETVKPGDVIKIKDAEITAVESFDRTVMMTDQRDLSKMTIEEYDKLIDQKAVNYVIKTSYGTVYHAADSHYSNAFYWHGQEHDIDIALITFGDNPDGMTDKMTAWDAYRAGMCLKAKVVIPMHYENWGIVEGDPTDLEMIAQKKFAPFKVCIMRPGTRYEWPADKDKPRIYYRQQTEVSKGFRKERVNLPFRIYL